ncbi:MAG: hypothetical protein WC369_02430 [Dehalococcoidales bacterium]|jgi:hypothetical protein
MTKRIITAFAVLSLLLMAGCDDLTELTRGTTETSSSPGFEILRGAEIGSEWKMNQIQIVIGPQDEFATLLRLTKNDNVDGYFYLEQSGNVTFEIEGDSLIYQTSDSSNRFSFVAGAPQGNTYVLTFRNPAAESETTQIVIIMEIIYPATGEMFFPVEVWEP